MNRRFISEPVSGDLKQQHSTEYIRRPHWCGKCNSEWFDNHTCPHVFNSSTGGNLAVAGWSEPPLILVKKYEWDWLWSEMERLAALLGEQADGSR